MKRVLPLSLLAAAYLSASDVTLDPIAVESTIISEVAEKAQTSADVAKALSDKVPSIDMSRRSGIANDIFIRGQKRDNIVVDMDGTKVCGACPNRMDPPASHIVTHQIDSIEIIEGPYDVENFGALSGEVKIKTKKPEEGFNASINTSFGSWNYRKFGATVSGGNDRVRALATASTERSDQYKDGNGDTLADQIENYFNSIPATDPMKAKVGGQRLQPAYYDMPAYEKTSAMAKLFIKTLEDQELRLSVTANRSDKILYANSGMDANYDDSNIYSAEYNINNINENFKNMNLQYYHSDVDHPMGTDYRMASLMMGKVMTNWLETSMDGVKLKNTFDLLAHKIVLGLDTSKRTWSGHYDVNHVEMTDSIAFTETKNAAVFAKLEKSYGDFDVEVGGRYDATTIKNDDFSSRTFNYISGNITSTYHINKENKVFLGIGQASRVPDARELYFQSFNMGSPIQFGTDSLNETTNKEIDLAYEADTENFKLKVKAFYSMLSGYIYFQKSAPTAPYKFHNIDATIYGGEFSASYYATNELTIDMGAAYKVGQKDKPLAGQTDKDLADITPLHGNIAANYEYTDNSMATLEVQSSAKWDKYDADNGEQEIAAWTILNAKVKHAVNHKFDLTVGVNNIFNETYAVSNTYMDLTLLSSGTTDVMLLNEPGRYFYTNLDFKF